METIETFEHKGFKIVIEVDEFAENPFEGWDWEPHTHFQTGVTWLQGSELPEVTAEFEEWNANEYGADKCAAKQNYISRINFGNNLDEDDVEHAGLTCVTKQDCVNCEDRCEAFKSWIYDNIDHWEERHEVLEWLAAHTILKVYKYEHSGVMYNTTGFSDPWDSGQVGYISAPNNTDVPDVKKYLEGLVKIFSCWASGSVYYWALLNAEGETLDSCSGYYCEYGDSSWDYMIQEAKQAAEAEFERLWEKRKNLVKERIK